MATRYELRAAPGPHHAPPSLDSDQRAVVEHPGGPLLVLAGPGTGKTTTIVETVAHRIGERGLRPDNVVVLTFGRKAADELRARIGARLDRTTAAPLATTFHSLCYALVRRFQDPEAFEQPLQLLSAAEQDSRIRDLLDGSPQTGRVRWPDDLRPALRTRGLASEMAELMSRARSVGLGPADLRRLAAHEQRGDWHAAGQFFGEYLDVLDAQNLLDYDELVHRALAIATDPLHQARLRDELKLVVVDEYQDTDPLQVELLEALSGGGRDLVVVGDPDQSIYAFRGADVRGMLDFPARFSTSDGDPAPTLALRSARRFGPVLLAASRAVIASNGVTGHLDPDTFAAFRQPRSVDARYGTGEVRVQTYASPAAEAESIAEQLRRAHLFEDVSWSQMAVLVRSGAASTPRLHRALVAAGVPVEAADDLPLRSAPAVAALLDALGLVEHLVESGSVPPEEAHAFLTGPLGGIDPSALRRLARELRRLEAGDGPETGAATGPMRSSDELVAEALSEPALLARVEHGRAAAVAGRVAKLAGLLADARRRVVERAAPEQVLWSLWYDSGWAARLRSTVDRGGEAARVAERDLDAVCALFELAARAEERQRRRGLSSFIAEIESHQVPADTLAQRGTPRDAVRLMTAHRSKGLEWRVVVVAGVQEGTWPDVRRRGSLLRSECLGTDGLAARPSLTTLVAEERRLFYVAVTRTQQRLVVTAVESAADDGNQPSRFLRELGDHLAERGQQPSLRLGRPERPLSLRGAVAELRRIAETTTNGDLRRAAVDRLARLAVPDESVGTACASPERWWGVRHPTTNARPVRPSDRALELSGSSLDGLVRCPLSWFFAHEAKAETPSTTSQGFGLVIHALAADVVRGTTPDDPAELVKRLDEVWQHLAFAAPWISSRERSEACQALERFVAWHRARGDRTAVAAEQSFCVTVPIGGDQVVLRGSMDRVEVDADGDIHVVDLKTARNQVPRDRVREHGQLGVYQVAVEAGAVDGLVPGAHSAGAELVQLRLDASARTPGVPKVQAQDPPRDGQAFVTVEQLERASRVLRREEFVATPGDEVCAHCQFRRLCPAQPEGRTILSPGDAEPSREREEAR